MTEGNHAPGWTSRDVVDKSTAGRVVIAGPGRAGTTLLVRLLDELGLDTGIERLSYYPEARAGLETSLMDPHAPRVVKDPRLSASLGTLLRAGRIAASDVEIVVLPIRALQAAALSRYRVSVDSGSLSARGGLWGARTLAGQSRWLASVTYELVLACAEFGIPILLLHYPRFVEDLAYAFHQLQPILAAGTNEGRFAAAWHRVVKPESPPQAMSAPPLGRVIVWRLRMLPRQAISAVRRLARRLKP